MFLKSLFKIKTGTRIFLTNGQRYEGYIFVSDHLRHGESHRSAINRLHKKIKKQYPDYKLSNISRIKIIQKYDVAWHYNVIINKGSIKEELTATFDFKP
jgi:hypothetical protein